MSTGYPTPSTGPGPGPGPYPPGAQGYPQQYPYQSLDQYGQNLYPPASMNYHQMQNAQANVPKQQQQQQPQQPQQQQQQQPQQGPPQGNMPLYDPRNNGFMGYAMQAQHQVNNGGMMSPVVGGPSPGYGQQPNMRYAMATNPYQQGPAGQPQTLIPNQMQPNQMMMSQLPSQLPSSQAGPSPMHPGMQQPHPMGMGPGMVPQQMMMGSQPQASPSSNQPGSSGPQQLTGRSPMNHMVRQQSESTLQSPSHKNGTFQPPPTARQKSQPVMQTPQMHPNHNNGGINNVPGTMGPPMIPPNLLGTTYSKQPNPQQIQQPPQQAQMQQQLQAQQQMQQAQMQQPQMQQAPQVMQPMQMQTAMFAHSAPTPPQQQDFSNSLTSSPRFPDKAPSPPRFDTPFTAVTHYDMPPALYHMQESFKRINPQLQRYFQRSKQPLRFPYPRPSQLAQACEPPTFGFLRDSKYFQSRFERRSVNPMPPPPAPLNRSQSMQGQIMSPNYSNSPASGPIKAAPKKSRTTAERNRRRTPAKQAGASEAEEPFSMPQQPSTSGMMMPQMGDQQQPPRVPMPYMMDGTPIPYNGMPPQHMQHMGPPNGYMMPMQQGEPVRPPFPMQDNGAMELDQRSLAAQRNGYLAPAETQCPQCLQMIPADAPSMTCMFDNCKKQFHMKCTGLHPSAFEKLQSQYPSARWNCYQCSQIAQQQH